jgi:hypothetical protein
MRIISSRRQFIADHSSTSYLFYAAKPLSKEARARVNTLSSHVDVGSRKAELQYHGDYADLDEARRKKFLEHYDVEVRESYDWWTLSVILEADKVKGIKLKDYKVEGEASLTFEKQGKRLCLCFDGWNQDYGASYDEFGEDTMEELAELGLELREELYAGTTDALQVMHDYCADRKISRGLSSPVAQKLASVLEIN